MRYPYRLQRRMGRCKTWVPERAGVPREEETVMKRRRLTSREARFVARERVVRVATAGRDRRPHVVPVCHVLERGRFYFGSDKRGLKVRNVIRTRWAALVADRYTERWSGLRGVSVVGRAEVFARGPVFELGRRLLYRKYRQYETQAALDPSDSVVVRVTPTHVMSWGVGR
jgi:nitroimidazol reductase NimA-like FMN-containing flavoprotein (pyridoxamine 5'-phosphate oxidase superfamily)